MLRVVPALLLLASGLAPSPTLRAQEVRTVLQQVTPIDWRRPEANLQVEHTDDRVRRVIWLAPGKAGPPVVIPLVNPVRDLEAALLPTRDALVLLAGGVRQGESLDLYVADRAGRLHTFESAGGTRLGQEFASGLGSWPVVDGHDLLMFAYLRQGCIEFRVLDLSWSDPRREGGSLLVSRQLAASGGGLAVRGFTAVSDLDSNRVFVEFDGGGAPIDFAHPLAPRVDLPQALLEFGASVPGEGVERVLAVGNTGRRTLRLKLATQAPFAIVGPLERAVEPGARTGITIRFQPAAAGSHQQRLQLDGNSSNPSLGVWLRGECVDPAVDPAPPVAVEPPKATGLEADPPEAPAAPASAPGLLTFVSLRIESEGDARVRVTGAANVGGPGIGLLVHSSGGGEAHASADASGAFRLELRASAGDRLQAVAIGSDGTRSQPCELGVVLPALRRTAQELELLGPPGKAFVLFAVGLAADGTTIATVEGSWRGELGASGSRRMALATLGAALPPAVVAVVDPAGRPRRSNLVVLR